MKNSLVSLGLILIAGSLAAQSPDPVVMKINGKDVIKSEFEYIYNKNNGEDAIDKRSLDEYVTLFKNFKLKVAEAEAQGIDTTAAFLSELNEYRQQLAQPYLETAKNEQLVRDAYDRSKESSEVSAILIAFPKLDRGLIPADTLASYKKAMEVWTKANKGADFETLVKDYSDDEGSKANERPGYIGWFSPANLIPSLELALCGTPVGVVSPPIRSSVGYYLLKINDRRANPEAAYDDVRPQLESKMEQTGSYTSLHQPGIDQWKTAHQYTLNEAAYRSLQEAAKRIHPLDSLYAATFADNQETLITIDNQAVPVADFIRHIASHPRSYLNVSTEYFSDKFDEFVFGRLSEAENSQLESTYPEFRNLMREYRDGILLFEVSNREVWEKASADTIGLTRYFETHQSEYAWDEPHWKGYIVLLKNAKAKKAIVKETRKMPADQAVQYLLDKYNMPDSIQIRAEKGLFVKEQNPFVDEAIFGGPKAELPQSYSDFLLLGKTLSSLPEEYADVKGLVITDYQDHLEQKWVKSLNEKYPVEIYKDVIAKEIK
jgi:peptidyl-prolyl cis-trans isomerase SurA